ncbi:sensory neuron membrane protein 1-like [Diabrotica virgifera virgifera]|uniref:Sensory neuron membrane protein 1-like n=1 Tax=Diabrotica virgifera virgifera TaxID=50390 RepID=A0ABM5KBE0_DIAVI|nr:sensory neuron membrane protein 1-like [Diabrotica virgifera virgifera]
MKLVEFQKLFYLISTVITTKFNRKMKLRFPVKLAIGSVFALFFIVLVGFILFPKMIHSKVKSMVNLGPGMEIRGMFLKVPFPLSFKIYVFNITNPMEIQNGAIPEVKEVGPFCFQEWKEKVDVHDEEDNDIITYLSKDTFTRTSGPGCVSGQTVVTIPHPMILGLVNAVSRAKPGALSLINKAIKSIYANPTSIFLTAKVDDILFDGVVIKCGVTDFAGKAICTQLRGSGSLKIIDENDLGFSLIGPKNATEQKRIKAIRGTKNHHDVGRIVEYDGSPAMSAWPTEECNKIMGTDGTVFPPMMTKEEGLVSFAPDLCRSLKAFWVKKTKYDGIPVNEYTASLGDSSKNEAEKCYCYTPDTCLKKGLMDLYKCAGVPIYVSMPHFYDSDESYVKGVKGLNPNKKEHEISILFEQMTGGPVSAKKRLQFSMPLEPNQKVDLFKNFTTTVIPMFWVEEGVDLNNTFTKPLKMLYTMKKVVNISKYLILSGSIVGCIAAAYLFFKNNDKVTITKVKDVQKVPAPPSGISTVNGHTNRAMSENEVDKF